MGTVRIPLHPEEQLRRNTASERDLRADLGDLVFYEPSLWNEESTLRRARHSAEKATAPRLTFFGTTFRPRGANLSA